jgi:MbtH protein
MVKGQLPLVTVDPRAEETRRAAAARTSGGEDVVAAKLQFGCVASEPRSHTFSNVVFFHLVPFGRIGNTEFTNATQCRSAQNDRTRAQMNHDELKREEYLVLINDEDQYCVWSAHHPVPAGWRATGPRGSREDCASYIDDVWTDMRPKSLRAALEQR